MPEVGRFASPDTLVPDPGNPQSFNRYTYVLNSPVNYTDPSGHRECAAICDGETPSWNTYQDAAWEGTWDIEQQAANVASAEGAATGVAETVIGVLWEPADWALALRDGFQWHDAIGFLPFIPATIGQHADDVIDLYRAVSPDELADILRTGNFRPHPGGRSNDIEWFSETFAGAKQWGKRLFEEFEVVSVTVPRNVADEMFQVRNLDRIANARGAMDDVLDRFNQAIIGLRVGK